MDAPRAKLDELREREQEARARIDEVGGQARAAAVELAHAREALTEAERLGAPAAERKRLEQRLAAAEQRHGEPWAERRAGAERAAMDARHAVQLHASEHLSELVAEIEERGRAAAEQVDAAAERFLDAVTRRAEVDQELTATLALVRRNKPGDVARSRADEARHAVAEFIQRGGEVPPTVRVELAATA
jgi:hypothetical protein